MTYRVDYTTKNQQKQIKPQNGGFLVEEAIYVDGGLVDYLVPPHGRAVAKTVIPPNNRVDCYLPTTNNTNNEAELFAILFGVVRAVKENIKIVYTDSQWALGAVTTYKVKNPRLKLLSNCIKALLKFYEIEIKWISREENLAT